MALAGLPASEVAAWLASDAACADDLPALADRLGPGHAAAVRVLLAGRPGAAVKYLLYFTGDGAGARDLLDPAAARTWDRLADPATPLPAPADVATFLRATAGLEGVLTRTQLARAAAVDCAAESAFLDALARRAAREVGAALLGAGPVRPSGPPPALLPEAAWLVPFSPERWLAAGADLSLSPPWRAWWLEGARTLRGDGRLARARLLGEGVRRRDADLLALGEAPPSLLAWVTTGRPVPLPPADGSWPSEADDLLAAALETSEFFSRLAGPLTDEVLAWVAGRDAGRGEFVRAGRFADALRLANRPTRTGWRGRPRRCRGRCCCTRSPPTVGEPRRRTGFSPLRPARLAPAGP